MKGEMKKFMVVNVYLSEGYKAADNGNKKSNLGFDLSKRSSIQLAILEYLYILILKALFENCTL